jgi:hypothetical protein
MRGIAVNRVLDRISSCCRRVPWHQGIDLWGVEESELDFLARYISELIDLPSRMRRRSNVDDLFVLRPRSTFTTEPDPEPLEKTSWDGRMARYFKATLDRVILASKIPLGYVDTRLRFIRILLRQTRSDNFIAPPKEWADKYWEGEEVPPFARKWWRPLYTGSGITGPKEVKIIKILLKTAPEEDPGVEVDQWNGSRPASPILKLQALDALVLSGQFQYVQAVFKQSINTTGRLHRADEALFTHSDIARGHPGLLRYAVESGSLEMVELIMEHRYDWPHGIPVAERIEEALVIAIRDRRRDIFDYIFEACGFDDFYSLGILLHTGLREACYQGDMYTVRLLLEQPAPASCGAWNNLGCCVTPLEIAARRGHLNIVRFLLMCGADPRGASDAVLAHEAAETAGVQVRRPTTPARKGWAAAHKYEDRYRRQIRTSGAMLGAAVGGHVKVAELLRAALAKAGMSLSWAEWERVALGAIATKRTAFVRWMLDQDLFPSWSGRPEYEPMTYACIWGSVETVKLLAARGFAVEGLGPYSVAGINHDSLVFLAMNFSRPDVVDALLELGAEPVDPMQTSLSRRWRDGVLPKKLRERAIKRNPYSGVF